MLEWLGGPLGDMVHARANEAGARGRHALAGMAGYIGTSIGTYLGRRELCSLCCCYVVYGRVPLPRSKASLCQGPQLGKSGASQMN